jgi:hypothetical protein
MNTHMVNYYATVQERADCTVVSFFYPSRRRPLQEVFYSFNEAIARLEKRGFTLYDYGEVSRVWSFIKAAKPRETRQAKARRALNQYLKEKENEYTF